MATYRIGEAEQERLGLFTEETGEANQIIGKILRHGIDSSNPIEAGSLDNRAMLEMEVGHVLAAVDILVACCTLSNEGLDRARAAKLQKLRSWLHCGTNLDAVEELLKAEDGRHLLKGSEAKLFIDAAREMIRDARKDFCRLAAPLLLDDVGRDAELQAFVKSLEAAIGECSAEQALDALKRRKAERNHALAKAHACGGCDAQDIGVASDGTEYCCHCGWNDPQADVAFACGKCGGRWGFAPSTLRDGWPTTQSECCGSGAWMTPVVP